MLAQVSATAKVAVSKRQTYRKSYRNACASCSLQPIAPQVLEAGMLMLNVCFFAADCNPSVRPSAVAHPLSLPNLLPMGTPKPKHASSRLSALLLGKDQKHPGSHPSELLPHTYLAASSTASWSLCNAALAATLAAWSMTSLAEHR